MGEKSVGQKLRFGVLGTGKIGRLHLESLLRHIPEAVVEHVADPFITAGTRAWLSSQGVEKISLNPDDLLADELVDAVLIASPTDTHAELIVKAARSGKQIFCEKPVDFDLEKILAAMREVKESGVKFQIGFNRRFDHNFKRMHEIVAAGKIGRPHITKISSRDPAPPSLEYVKSSGGIFMDQMIHDFDMIRYLTGNEAVSVFAQGSVQILREIGELGDVDTAVVMLEFEDGTIGIIDNSRQAVYGYDQRAEVFGSNGCCLTDNDTATRVATVTKEGTVTDVPPYFFMQRYVQAYVDELRSFVHDVQNDIAPACGIEDAIRPVVIAKAAAQSLKSGVPVRAAEILGPEELEALLS